MRTAVAETSINAYRGIVPSFKNGQESAILDHVAKHGESTIGEIAHALRMEKSTVSARQNSLRKLGYLVQGAVRKCRISGINCTPVKLPARQMGLFN